MPAGNRLCVLKEGMKILPSDKLLKNLRPRERTTGQRRRPTLVRNPNSLSSRHAIPLILSLVAVVVVIKLPKPFLGFESGG